MFGVDFSELMVILLVALVVIGPERMPKVARTMGSLWGRAQRFVNNVKSDISRDIAIEDYRKLSQEIQEQASSLGQTLKEGTQGLTQQVQEIGDTVKDAAQNPVAEAGGGNLPARSVPAAAAASRKVNLCALVDRAMAANIPLEDEPEFQTLTEVEKESARKQHAQEMKVLGIRNKAYEEVERAQKLAALEEAKAAKAKAKSEEQAKNKDLQVTATQTQDDPTAQTDKIESAQTEALPQRLPEQKKFLID